MIYMSFFIGLILICKGGDWFVDAASKLSEILGIPKYVIGATIVSFATTMPEIIVSVAAALDGHSAMAIGNAVGSVSANTGIILALSLFFLPVAIKREEYLFKNSLYIGTLLLLLISFKDRIFDRADCLHYNSCRDRCCPMCQEFPKEKWVDARREDILDAPYFHVVFTVPEELNPIIYSNQKFLYAALYHAASDTLSELAADSKYLGTDIGYICILHTWGSTMNFHPHIHAIVLGGGLDVKNHWKDNGKDFFLPIKVISKTFRGKYMAELLGRCQTKRAAKRTKKRNHWNKSEDSSIRSYGGRNL